MADSGSSVLKFTGITHAGKAGSGAFKLNEAQLGWAATETAGGPQTQVSFLGKELASAEWQQVCGKSKALLKLRFKGDQSVSRFAGFRQEDFPALKAHMQKHYGAALVEQPISTKGWSWFDWDLDTGGLELRLMEDGKAGIDVPLDDLSQITTVGKNELSLEFQDDTCLGADEVIHEIRFALPTGDVKLELSADQLKEELQKRTGLSATGEALARISDVTVVQPRGKHDFEFFQHAVKVHGKTQTYTIKYASISKAFLLELPNDSPAVVVHLDPPLRQGQAQLQSYLVMTFDRERRVPVELPEEMLKAMHFAAGEEHPVYSLVAKLINQLSKKSIIAPSTEFRDLLQKDQECFVRCSVKTQPGFLFPTKRSMIFVTKPVIWIRYEEIEGIEFKSSQMRKSSFDLLVQTKRQQVVEFSQLERGKVLEAIYTFFRKMEVKIVNQKEAESLFSTTSSSSRATTKPQLPGSSLGAGKPAEAEGKEEDDDYDEEEADEDFDEDEAENDDDSSADMEEELEDDEPQQKRAKRGRR